MTKPKMISFDEAYAAMMAAAKPPASERVPIAQALGRVLAEDVHADVNMPPFNKSAMDGYACRRADLDQAWTMVEEIPAGVMPKEVIGPGQCAKIMTGAPVPQGADRVVMVEDTEHADGLVRFTGETTRDNICLEGEDVRAGDAVLAAGEILTPSHIAVLAAVGCSRPAVGHRPRVAVMATGSELVEPGETPTGAQIRNSNSVQLCAQLQNIGIEAACLGIVPDTFSDTIAAVGAAVTDADLLIFSGGVSMGDYDFVPQALHDCGFEFAFESVAMKPGRPTVFGTNGAAYCCGLPGNPVSSFVVFEILLKPFLYKLMGHDYQPRLLPSKLGQDVRRKKTGRQATIPVAFGEGGIVLPLAYHGSAHIHAITKADALLTIPADQALIEKGNVVHVRPL